MKSYEERLPLIKQAIKDLHWDLGNTWGGEDDTDLYLYLDNTDQDYSLCHEYVSCYRKFTYICTVDEFYNYRGSINMKDKYVVTECMGVKQVGFNGDKGVATLSVEEVVKHLNGFNQTCEMLEKDIQELKVRKNKVIATLLECL